ncbi:antitoxin Xre/MbcA/ParS toxin-binding domain-containing protein [Croceibacterium soli]|uniref:antitoxin Xre/MbcA/ParS toxin-binding domain-containing protein n=1 Tax=Croceibacterium soli TaxID=1739690 RepID=UPI002E256E99
MLLLGIFRLIGALISDPEHANAWMRATNRAPLFGGRSALGLMHENGIDVVQRESLPSRPTARHHDLKVPRHPVAN